MRILIVEDDTICSRYMLQIFNGIAECDVAEDGGTALDLFSQSVEEGKPYRIVFLDIMMPSIDGQEVLSKMREIEALYKIVGLETAKIIMTTALDDFNNINTAFEHQCDSYLIKPIEKQVLLEKLKELDVAPFFI